jgi:lysophospholipase L1-like esterase
MTRLALAAAIALSSSIAFAQEKPAAEPKPAAQPAPVVPVQPRPEESPSEPKIKNPDFVKRHEGFLADIKNADGKVDVAFFGDSITDGWRNRAGKEAWDKYFAPLHPINFGIGGDRTQHVLWRMQNGELDGYKAKAIVIMIGTNNLGANKKNADIAAGITKVVEEARKRQPQAKVLLLGVFPRSAKADDPIRARIKEINAAIARLDDGKTIHYLDIGDKFLEPDGTLTREVMPDLLHLSPKGYDIWGSVVAPKLKELLQ